MSCFIDVKGTLHKELVKLLSAGGTSQLMDAVAGQTRAVCRLAPGPFLPFVPLNGSQREPFAEPTGRWCYSPWIRHCTVHVVPHLQDAVVYPLNCAAA